MLLVIPFSWIIVTFRTFSGILTGWRDIALGAIWAESQRGAIGIPALRPDLARQHAQCICDITLNSRVSTTFGVTEGAFVKSRIASEVGD